MFEADLVLMKVVDVPLGVALSMEKRPSNV